MKKIFPMYFVCTKYGCLWMKLRFNVALEISKPKPAASSSPTNTL